MTIALIVITYNAPDKLALVLESIRRQTQLPTEVIIADDGSAAPTGELVRGLKAKFPCALRHVWHPDEGFRGALARNNAIRVASADYIIFLDGDLMLHPRFVEDFARAARPRQALIGSRLFLSKPYTERLLAQGANYKLNTLTIPFSGGVEKNRLNGVRVPSLYRLFPVYRKASRRLHGGLLGVSRKALVAIDGWDAIYEGWGGEDTDLVVRLIHSGCTVQKLKHLAPTYHLWHPHASRARTEANFKLLDECVAERRVKAVKGLSFLGDK